MSLTLLQVVGSSFNGPIYKEILPDIRRILPTVFFVIYLAAFSVRRLWGTVVQCMYVCMYVCM